MEQCEIGEILYGKSSDVGTAVTPEKYTVPEDESESPLSSSSEDEDDDAEEWDPDPRVAEENNHETVDRASKPLGHGVLADLPLNHEDVECQLEELDVLKRNWQLRQMKLGSSERLVSAIFETKGTESVRMTDDVIISIPVQLPRSKVRPEKMYDFHIMVEHSGMWTSHPAEYKNRMVKATVKHFKSLCVTARVKPEEHVVSPTGYKFVSQKDSDVTVDFPEGTVEKDTKFKFIVETVDPKRSREYKTYNPAAFNGILDFSTTLRVQQVQNVGLCQQVEITLPIHKSEECMFEDDDEEETEVVFLRWEGDSVEIVKAKPTRKENRYSIIVSHFSGYSAVRKERSASPQDVLTAARILSGKENLCTLLSFIRFRALGPLVLVDVVESGRADKVALRHRKQGLKEIELSRSRDIPVSDRERIKIELSGNLLPTPGVPRDVYNLTFVKAATTNNVTFPLQTRLSSSSHSIITFRGARGRWVHSIHFSVGLGPRGAKNALISPTTLALPLPSALQPDLKYRPVSDVPVTRVVFRQKETVDGQSDDVRPPTSQSAITALSLGAESEMDSMFERPVSRGASVKSEPTSTSAAIGSKQGKDVYHGHPMLSEKSLQVLSEQLSLTEWNRVLVELTISTSDIARVCEEAGRQHFSQSFKLLLHWTQVKKGRPDRDLINDLVAAFTELGRTDMTEVIRKAGRTYRNFKRSDFKRMT